MSLFFVVAIYDLALRRNSPLITPFALKQKQSELVRPHISINEIFDSNHSWIATLSADYTTTLIATGDVIPARSVNYQMAIRNNFKWVFEKTDNVLKSADITLINLESPLVKNCPLTNTGMVFCGDEKNIEGLVFAGVDVANLANNHSGNYGLDGIENTVELLNKSGIMATGVSGAVFKEIKGIKFAFLGYNNITSGKLLSWTNKDKIKSEVSLTKKNSDVVVVSFHWGDEYTSQPNQKQKQLAHLAIDSGADLIIGNHPHWIQPVEIYKNKFITYAHGNFIFDQMWSEKTKEGVIGKYTFYDKNLVDVEFLPVKIENYGQPYFLEEDNKTKIIEEMKNESKHSGLRN